jgi:molecular chaperone HscB
VRLRRIVQRLIDFSQDYFTLFGLPRRFRFDADKLDAAFRDLQRDVHPDRYASATEAERRLALQSSARVNEAYLALKDPVSRAQYLLSLHGIDALRETDTAVSPDFLQQQLERRESIAEAQTEGDAAKMAALLEGARVDIAVLETKLADDFDKTRDLEVAREGVRELRFLTKVAADIESALAEIEE